MHEWMRSDARFYMAADECVAAGQYAPHSFVEDVICEKTLFRGRSSPTTSYQTMPQNAGSFQNCKDNILWFWSSAAEATAQRTAGKPKGSSNCIASSR
jgi:hypothetical protein